MGKTQDKKPSIVWPIIGIILCTLMSAVLFIGYSDYLLGDARDLYDYLDDGVTPRKGEHVKVDVDAVVDWYAETEHRINGFIPAGSEQHCVVWLDNNAFISMTIKGKKNIAKVDEIIKATYAYLDYLDGVGSEVSLPAPVTFEGEITSIGSEVYEYWDDAMDILGVRDVEGFEVYDVTIDTTSTKAKLWAMIGLFVVLDIVIIRTLTVNIKKRKQLKLEASSLSYSAGSNDAFNMYQDAGNTYNQTYDNNNNNNNTYM